MLAEALAAPSRGSAASPFAVTGLALIASGYSAIPIAPGDKIPGLYAGGEWRLMREWQRFCDEPPRSNFINGWSRWPNAGVGIALGRGVVAVDIDLDDAVAAVMAALPPAIVAKKGAKGLTLFFRGDTSKIKSRAFRIGGIGAVDLLSHGKQSVLPPSIHPKTGRPYEWMSFKTLAEVPLAELTEAPDNLADLIAAALKPFGYKAESSFEWDGTVKDSESQSGDFFRRLNEDALANLDAWIPKLGLFKANRESDGGWRAVAHWRPSSTGQPHNRRKPNLSFDSRGIRDFGDGMKYTPINVVLAALDLGKDIDTAAKWLGEALGRNLDPLIALVAGPSAVSVRAAFAAPNDERDESGEGDETLPVPTRDELERLCHPPGLVGQIMDWIDGSARQPCRALALGPALTLIAALAGRHNSGPTDLRPNLYVVALAKSGFGKDHARKCINRLTTAAGLDRWLGPEDIGSDSGLRGHVEMQPASVCLLDEFGGLIAKIMDRKAGQHMAGIRHMLLKLYTSSDSTYRGAAYAQQTATPIHNPCLSIYGTTTPHDFWPALSAKGVNDGFLPRFLVLNIEGDPAKAIVPDGQRQPPKAIIDKCRALVKPHGGNLAEFCGPVEPRRARWGEGAEAVFNDADDACRRRAAGKGESDVLWTRAMEQALKLAHIVALGLDPEAPVITRELMTWGAELAVLSTRIFISELNDRLASNDRQAEYLQVKRIVRAAGASGLTARDIGRKLNGALDRKRRDEVITQLVEDGHVRAEEVKPDGGGRPTVRFYAR